MRWLLAAMALLYSGCPQVRCMYVGDGRSGKITIDAFGNITTTINGGEPDDSWGCPDVDSGRNASSAKPCDTMDEFPGSINAPGSRFRCYPREPFREWWTSPEAVALVSNWPAALVRLAQ